MDSKSGSNPEDAKPRVEVPRDSSRTTFGSVPTIISSPLEAFVNFPVIMNFDILFLLIHHVHHVHPFPLFKKLLAQASVVQIKPILGKVSLDQDISIL